MFSLTSSSNATLKDEQKLASGDCGHVTFVVSVVLSPDFGRGGGLPVEEVLSYHFHSGHVEPTRGLRVELIPVCVVAGVQISLETSSSASAASCGRSRSLAHCCVSSHTHPATEEDQIMTIHQGAVVLLVL